MEKTLEQKVTALEERLTSVGIAFEEKKEHSELSEFTCDSKEISFTREGIKHEVIIRTYSNSEKVIPSQVQISIRKFDLYSLLSCLDSGFEVQEDKFTTGAFFRFTNNESYIEFQI